MDTAWHMEVIISVDRMALAVAMTVACKQDQVNAHIGCGWCTQADEEDQLTGGCHAFDVKPPWEAIENW